jgi:hypothetical protein
MQEIKLIIPPLDQITRGDLKSALYMIDSMSTFLYLGCVCFIIWCFCHYKIWDKFK